MGFCLCIMVCCALLCVLSSFAIILMGKRELSALLLFSLNNMLFKYKVHQDTIDTSYTQYSIFERDTEISLK